MRPWRWDRNLWTRNRRSCRSEPLPSTTSFFSQRDLTTAQYAEIEAADAYAKALVAMDQARGGMLERNGMTFGDALRARSPRQPAPPFNNGSNRGSGKTRGQKNCFEKIQGSGVGDSWTPWKYLRLRAHTFCGYGSLLCPGSRRSYSGRTAAQSRFRGGGCSQSAYPTTARTPDGFRT